MVSFVVKGGRREMTRVAEKRARREDGEEGAVEGAEGTGGGGRKREAREGSPRAWLVKPVPASMMMPHSSSEQVTEEMKSPSSRPFSMCRAMRSAATL